MGSRSVGGFRFVGRRRRLIEEIRASGVEDLELLELFDRVPRHLFIPQGMWHRAYKDAPVPIGFGQTASQPSLQAHYLRILRPAGNERVLEIGTGSGFLTALLAHLADRVYSVERVRELSVRARHVLDRLALQNVALMVGDGTIGWRKFAPFDVVVVSAASPEVPGALVDQMSASGRMLLPVGTRDRQDLLLVRMEGGRAEEEVVQEACTFVPLIGRHGWNEGEDGG